MAAVDSGIAESAAMCATTHRSIRYPGLPSLARQELASGWNPRSLCAPPLFRWHRARRSAVPMPRTVHWSRLAGRLFDRGRHHPFHHVAESGGMQPALLTDQIVNIFLDETLVAIDAPSAWTYRSVA